MASILDSVDAYKDLLGELWKDKYKEELPEDISLLLGELKFKLEAIPHTAEPINEELLIIKDN